MAVKSENELSSRARSHWLKAQSAVELRNFDYAISLLQDVLKEEPAFLDGRRWLRQAEIAKAGNKKSFLKGLSGSQLHVMKAQGLVKKEPLAAIEAAEKILESEPTSQPANLLLKEAALAADLPETAGFALETLRDAFPADTKVLHLLGRFYFEYGDPEKAVDVYNKISELNPADIESVKFGKDAAAKASIKRGGWDSATSYKDVMNKQDDSVQREIENRAHKDEETIDRLLVELGKQYQENPQNLDVVRRMANLYEQRPDLDSALEWYQYAVSLTQGSDPGLLRKVSDLSIRKLGRRIDEIEAWLATGPEENDETVAFRAELEQLKKERAETQMMEAKRRVERNPTDLLLRLELGELLVNTGNYSEAITELQKARSAPNGRYKAIMLLGKCYMARKMYDLAVGQLTEAANELNTMDALKKEIVYTLGLIFEKMGNKEKSLERMKEIYAVDAGYLDVAQRVESSYE